jgi:hypothetical protein
MSSTGAVVVMLEYGMHYRPSGSRENKDFVNHGEKVFIILYDLEVYI